MLDHEQLVFVPDTLRVTNLVKLNDTNNIVRERNEKIVRIRQDRNSSSIQGNQRGCLQSNNLSTV